jgi:site-specific DNA-methyltransferase (adenine-specific)
MKKNKIYLGDATKLIKKLDDNSVDLIIADPPYNLNKNFGNKSDNWKTVDDWMDWNKVWLLESKRVLKDSGSIFVYGIHKYICHIQCYLYEIGLCYGRQFIWHYENGWSMYKKAPAANYEPILWFTKSNHYTYHIMREPYKSTERLKHKIIKNGKVWKPNPEGKMGGDVWKIPTLAGRRFSKEKVDHPTQKPLKLCNKIIKHFSNKKGLVLIPFVGSGSECISAIGNDRNYIGFEMNKEYIDIATSRIKESTTLFAESVE